jgi:hypothetical protein
MATPDPLLMVWQPVAEVLGPLDVLLACGHRRSVELEVDRRVLLRSSMPCPKCPKGAKGGRCRVG